MHLVRLIGVVSGRGGGRDMDVATRMVTAHWRRRIYKLKRKKRFEERKNDIDAMLYAYLAYSTIWLLLLCSARSILED